MTFADLIAGDAVFVDANTFIYHFEPHAIWGPPCTQLLADIENQRLTAFTSSHVISELSHRLMTLEAHTLLGWPIAGIGNRLRMHPADVQRLGKFRSAVEKLVQSKLQILPVTPALLAAGVAACQQIGLLSNDALIVAIMRANGLSKLASSDADFDRVVGLARYAPL